MHQTWQRFRFACRTNAAVVFVVYQLKKKSLCSSLVSRHPHEQCAVSFSAYSIRTTLRSREQAKLLQWRRSCLLGASLPPPPPPSPGGSGTRWSSVAATTASSPPPTSPAPASPSPSSRSATSSAAPPSPRSSSQASSSPDVATSSASSAPPSSGKPPISISVEISRPLLIWSSLVKLGLRELELERHGLKLLRRSPSSFTPCLDGRYLLLGADAELNHSEIAKFSKKDALAYPRW